MNMKEKIGGILLMILALSFGYVSFDGKTLQGFYLFLHLAFISFIFSLGLIVIIFKPDSKLNEIKDIKI
jgi:hypothetical protein